MADLSHPKVQGSLAGVVLIGVVVFLYQVAGVVEKIQSWEVLWNPPTVGQLLYAVVAGLIAVAAALGLDIPVLLRGIGLKKPPDDE